MDTPDGYIYEIWAVEPGDFEARWIKCLSEFAPLETEILAPDQFEPTSTRYIKNVRPLFAKVE